MLYGYFPNTAKTWLIVIPDQLDSAQTLFKGTNIQISCEDQRHLGAAIGTRAFTENMFPRKCKYGQKKFILYLILLNLTPIVLTVHLPMVLNIDGIM